MSGPVAGQPSTPQPPGLGVVVLMSLIFGIIGALSVKYLSDRLDPAPAGHTQFAVYNGSMLTYASISDYSVHGDRSPIELVEEIYEAIEMIGEETGFVILEKGLVKYGQLPDITEEVAEIANLDLTLKPNTDPTDQ